MKNPIPGPIAADLRKIAPSISFSVELSEDHNYRWDGDGPDPAEDGYVPYDVDVTAKAIVDGDEIVGRASLGGHYQKPGEPDPEIGGYLPQMLQEAADELLKEIPTGRSRAGIRMEAREASTYLTRLMRALYDAQRAEIEGR